MPSSAGRRGGSAASAAARGTAGCGDRRRLGRARRRKQQRRRGRGRPREAHAAAHRIAPVDVPSKADQPRELRLVAVLSGLEHGLAHRVAHRVRRALQDFARSDTCAFGGGHTHGSAVTLERRQRALRPGAHAARPLSSGGGGRRGIPPHTTPYHPIPPIPPHTTPYHPQRLAPEAPNVCEAGHRAPRGHWAIHLWH